MFALVDLTSSQICVHEMDHPKLAKAERRLWGRGIERRHDSAASYRQMKPSSLHRRSPRCDEFCGSPRVIVRNLEVTVALVVHYIT
jgi:hypothetical protein